MYQSQSWKRKSVGRAGKPQMMSGKLENEKRKSEGRPTRKHSFDHLPAGPTPSPSSWQWSGARDNFSHSCKKGRHRAGWLARVAKACIIFITLFLPNQARCQSFSDSFPAKSNFSGLGWLWKCCDSTLCHLPGGTGRPSRMLMLQRHTDHD